MRFRRSVKKLRALLQRMINFSFADLWVTVWMTKDQEEQEKFWITVTENVAFISIFNKLIVQHFFFITGFSLTFGLTRNCLTPILPVDALWKCLLYILITKFVHASLHLKFSLFWHSSTWCALKNNRHASFTFFFFWISRKAKMLKSPSKKFFFFGVLSTLPQKSPASGYATSRLTYQVISRITLKNLSKCLGRTADSQ